MLVGARQAVRLQIQVAKGEVDRAVAWWLFRAEPIMLDNDLDHWLNISAFALSIVYFLQPCENNMIEKHI